MFVPFNSLWVEYTYKYGFGSCIETSEVHETFTVFSVVKKILRNILGALSKHMLIIK